MDIFAHAAWTNIVFYKKYKKERLNRFLSVLFGLLPDFASFSPIFIYGFFTSTKFFDLVGLDLWVVNFANESYKYTHSIIIFALVALLIYFLRGRVWYWPMFGWALHILIDIGTHKNFYETPFLFPISDYKFGYGISWAHPTFMLLNYGLLAVFYICWFFVVRNRKTQSSS